MVFCWDAHFGTTWAHNHPSQTLNILNNKRSYFANAQHSNNIISHSIDINNYFNYITYIYLFIYNANLVGTGLSMLGFKIESFPFRNGKLPVSKLEASRLEISHLKPPILKTCMCSSNKVYINEYEQKWMLCADIVIQ